jgi:CBS domain-containing protein
MTESPKAIDANMSVADAADRMRSSDVGALPVVEGNDLVGIVTDRDLVVRVLAEKQDPQAVRIGELASKSPVTVGPDEKLSEARDLMERHQVRRLPVMKDGDLVGIISLGDIAWQDASLREVGEALRSVSESQSTQDSNEGPARGTPNTENRDRGAPR